MNTKTLKARSILLAAGILLSACATNKTKPSFPTPKISESFASYCTQLSSGTSKIKCSSHTDKTEQMTFVTDDFEQIFEIAKKLYNIPRSLMIPAKGPEKQLIEESHKPENVWISELEIARSPSGQVNQVQYRLRQEGFGSRVQVERKGDSIEIKHTIFAD
jgi:hypothetical protein